jgi:hypothetical protein
MDTVKSKARVVQHGDQWAIMIDQTLLDQMHITSETIFDATTDGAMLVLTPEQNEERRAAFLASIEAMDQRYSSVFKRLAE